MNRREFLRFSFSSALLLASGTPADAGNVLRIGGTGASIGLLSAIAAAFEREHPGLRVNQTPSLGSSGGIRALTDGVLDIAATSRPLREKERARGLQEVPYARTPMLFVTSLQSPGLAPTWTVVERIYRHERSAWPDGTPIRIVYRPSSETDTKLLAAARPALGPLLTAAADRPDIPLALTDQENLEMASSLAGSFAFAALTTVLTSGYSLTRLPLNGVAATPANLAAGAYPLAKRLNLVVRADAGPHTIAFVRLLRSPQGARILHETGNLPLDG